MERHRFNFFPEMSDEEYEKLVTDIKTHGYDQSQPIYIYENAILDGWNRFRACGELEIQPFYKEFKGTDYEAICFMSRTNTRRNLTSQQRAAIAVMNDDIVNAIREEVEKRRREKQGATKTANTKAKLLCDKKLSHNNLSNETETSGKESLETLQSEKEQSSANDSPNVAPQEIQIQEPAIVYDDDYKPKTPKRNEHENTVSTQLATTNNTNRAYTSDALKLKQTAPEKLKEVASGKTTFQQIKKEQPPQPSPPKTAVSETDDFTETAARHGRILMQTFKTLEEQIIAARNDFHANGQDFFNYAKETGVLRLQPMIDNARSLKTLKKCVNCKNKEGDKEKCQWCKQAGYQNSLDYSLTKEAI